MPAGRLLPSAKLPRKMTAQRHATRRTAALGRVELAENVVAHNANSAVLPGDVLPAQCGQLALTQPGHCGRQVQRPVKLLMFTKSSGIGECFNLLHRQVTNLRGSGESRQSPPTATEPHWNLEALSDAQKPHRMGPSTNGRYWARTSDLRLVEAALSQLS
jgi:hypothetical protein